MKIRFDIREKIVFLSPLHHTSQEVILSFNSQTHLVTWKREFGVIKIKLSSWQACVFFSYPVNRNR